MKSAIRVAHVHLETTLEISEDRVQLLVVENPKTFYETVTDLEKQMGGGEGTFVFSVDGRPIEPHSYGELICDVFHFDLNDKKVLNALYKKLEQTAFAERLPLFNELSAKTVAFLEEISLQTAFSLEYDEPQPIDYFKAAAVKFAKTYDSLEEKLICYINALVELKKCEFFIFVNLKSVFSDEQLTRLYEHCRREQVGLLLIESGKLRPFLPEEKVVIVTEDLCEIVAGYENL